MAKKTREILVGDLLVKAGVIERRDLADALPISLKTALPVGRILISHGSLKEQTLQAALFAQSLVRDCLLSEEIAAQALSMLHGQQITLEEALAKLGWRSESYELTNRLGQLFLDAGIITEEELASGLEGFYTAGLPLARVLVIQGVINNNIAFSALTAQKLVRDNLISREQAIEALRSAAANETTIEESLSIHGYLQLYPQNTIRLGELLVLAGITTEAELLENVERSLNYEEYIGETYVHTGQLPKNILEAALELQRLSTKNEIEPREAADALRRIAATNMSVEEAIKEQKGPPEMRAELLGLISQAEAEIAAQKKSDPKKSAGEGKKPKDKSGKGSKVGKFTRVSAEQVGDEELLDDELARARALRDEVTEPYLALLKDAISKGDIASSPQVRDQLLGLIGKDSDDKTEDDSTPRSSAELFQFLVTDQAIDLQTLDDSADEDNEVTPENTADMEEYLIALQQSVIQEIRRRKAGKENKSRRRKRLNRQDSALLAMAELQMSMPQKREHTGGTGQQSKLISKLIRRVEELSYRAGFLEGCIATSNSEADLEEHLASYGYEVGREGITEPCENGSDSGSGAGSSKEQTKIPGQTQNSQLFKRSLMLSACTTKYGTNASGRRKARKEES